MSPKCTVYLSAQEVNLIQTALTWVAAGGAACDAVAAGLALGTVTAPAAAVVGGGCAVITVLSGLGAAQLNSANQAQNGIIVEWRTVLGRTGWTVRSQ
jgi:hypothetical protein